MKRFFLFIGNLAASILENVSTQAEEQPLCKTYTRRSELFRTNHFWRVDKVSDEIKPHNKKQEIPQQSLRVLTFFYRKPFLLQFLQSPGTCFIREQRNFTNLVIQGLSVLFWWAVNLQMNPTMKYQGAFSRIVGFTGKHFLFSPPPPFFFFLARSNFRAISRLEMLAM